MKVYLRTSNGRIEFITDDIHDIKETDIPVTKEDYELFFESQANGIQYKLRDMIPLSNDISLFDTVEEFVSEPIAIEKTDVEIKIDNLIEENKQLKIENESLKQDIYAIKQALNI